MFRFRAWAFVFICLQCCSPLNAFFGKNCSDNGQFGDVQNLNSTKKILNQSYEIFEPRVWTDELNFLQNGTTQPQVLSSDTPPSDVSLANPFSPSDTETEYIPPSTVSSSSDSEEGKKVYDFHDSADEIIDWSKKRSRVEISESNQNKRPNLIIDTNYENNFETFAFEYDTNFKGNFLFDDEKIENVKHYFDHLLPSQYSKLVNKKGREEIRKREQPTKKNEINNVYASPYLKIHRFKKTVCKFCESEITSKHFARHLERQHSSERQVKELLALKSGSKEKKHHLMLLRNEGNLDDAIRGKIVPKKRELNKDASEKEYVICIHCKGYYKRLSLSRHVKKCFARKEDSYNIGYKRTLAESIAFTACHKKYGEILSKLNVKNEIFSKMQGDDITKAAVEDILIVYYGEDLLKKTKMKRSFYHISNKLRECARFLIEIKKIDSFDDMISILKPESFDKAVEAVKSLSKYDAVTRSFGAPSLALHFRTTLSALCDLASKLILRKKIPYLGDVEEILKNVERFKNLVDSQWTIEIGSLALKDLNEKSSTNPKLLPITEDIMKLAKLVEKTAEEIYIKLCISKDKKSYRILAETVLVLTILHNRKRVGDVQYLEWKSCEQQLKAENVVQQNELAASLSETEKILTQNYKKITSIGKGSRAVTILVPKKIQKYLLLLCTLRNENWFSAENIYLFTYPQTTHWIDGCTAIRKYASMCNAKHPTLLTSSRLRKHIATVTQLFSLKANEVDQLAKFMGHTTKTHESFYKLPQDVYQIAKVSKILQIMEKGNATQFKNKSLDEIDIDLETIDELEVPNNKRDPTDQNKLVNEEAISDTSTFNNNYPKTCANNSSCEKEAIFKGTITHRTSSIINNASQSNFSNYCGETTQSFIQTFKNQSLLGNRKSLTSRNGTGTEQSNCTGGLNNSGASEPKMDMEIMTSNGTGLIANNIQPLMNNTNQNVMINRTNIMTNSTKMSNNTNLVLIFKSLITNNNTNMIANYSTIMTNNNLITNNYTNMFTNYSTIMTDNAKHNYTNTMASTRKLMSNYTSSMHNNTNMMTNNTNLLFKTNNTNMMGNNTNIISNCTTPMAPNNTYVMGNNTNIMNSNNTQVLTNSTLMNTNNTQMLMTNNTDLIANNTNIVANTTQMVSNMTQMSTNNTNLINNMTGNDVLTMTTHETMIGNGKMAFINAINIYLNYTRTTLENKNFTMAVTNGTMLFSGINARNITMVPLNVTSQYSVANWILTRQAKIEEASTYEHLVFTIASTCAAMCVYSLSNPFACVKV